MPCFRNKYGSLTVKQALELNKAAKWFCNYFDTREEAEKAVEKLKAWKRLKDKGVMFDGCFDRFGETHNHRDVVVFLLRVEAPDYGEKSSDEIEDDLDLLFGGEE